jgi:hypothetical protein
MYVRAQIVFAAQPANGAIDHFRYELAKRGAERVVAVAEADGTTRVACRIWLSSILDPYAAAYEAINEAIVAAGLSDGQISVG